MIDLHTHTTLSDGTYTPAQLIDLAHTTGITLLGITDHDSFDGYDEALPHLGASGVHLVCGIELSTKYQGQTTHLLAYYLNGVPNAAREVIRQLQASREERNLQLVERLRAGGVAITLDDVKARSSHMTGRPHFAQVLVDKGYASSVQDAFDRFLDESAPFYVDRDEPQLLSTIGMVRQHGGVTSLAHPCRFHFDLDTVLPELASAGLDALEAYHSDHTPVQTAHYLACAKRHGLAVTGGSDFHGAAKPGLMLGTGRDGNLQIPGDLFEELQRSVQQRRNTELCTRTPPL